MFFGIFFLAQRRDSKKMPTTQSVTALRIMCDARDVGLSVQTGMPQALGGLYLIILLNPAHRQNLSLPNKTTKRTKMNAEYASQSQQRKLKLARTIMKLCFGATQ